MAKVVEDRSPYHNIIIDQSLTGRTAITIDGMELKGVRTIGFDQSYDTTPEVTVELVPNRLNVGVLAKLGVEIDIGDIHDAINCLQLEMKLNEEFRDAMIASVSSALVEHDIHKESVTEIAEAVVERVFEGCK